MFVHPFLGRADSGFRDQFLQVTRQKILPGIYPGPYIDENIVLQFIDLRQHPQRGVFVDLFRVNIRHGVKTIE